MRRALTALLTLICGPVQTPAGGSVLCCAACRAHEAAAVGPAAQIKAARIWLRLGLLQLPPLGKCGFIDS